MADKKTKALFIQGAAEPPELLRGRDGTVGGLTGRPVIAIEEVFLRGEDNLLYGPLTLSLEPGQGALITVDGLSLMRRLMKCCLGFVRPAAGRISWWRDIDLEEDGSLNRSLYELYRHIGYVDRQCQILTAITLLENLVLFHDYAGLPEAVARSRRLLDQFNLADDEGLKGYALPEPDRRRALYALAFCGEPRLVLLERPIQFLDRDFDLIWDLVLRRAQEDGLAYIVFDRTRNLYNEEHFGHFAAFTPGHF